LSPATVTTASTGQASFTVTATKSGTDTITATTPDYTPSPTFGETATVSVAVSAQNFAFTNPPASATTTDVDLGVSQTLSVVWTVSGVAQAGQVITFAATRGTLSSTTATTDATGTATVTISSTVAGPADQSGVHLGLTGLHRSAGEPGDHRHPRAKYVDGSGSRCE
jgi:hypothetical protein